MLRRSMHSTIRRPLGVTLLALPFLWIGGFGSLIFPIFLVTGASYMAWEQIAPGFLQSRHALLVTTGVVFSCVWYAGYLLYAYIGIGFWKLWPKARIAAIWVHALLIVSGLGIMALFRGLSLLIGFGAFILAAGLFILAAGFGLAVIWYLRRPTVVWTFAAAEAERRSLPMPPPPAQVNTPPPWVMVSVGLALCVIVGGTFVTSLLIGIQHMFKRSEVYSAALQRAQDSPCVTKRLGKPIAAHGFISGNINEVNSAGSAELEIPVRGNQGSGTLKVSASRNDGQWSIDELTVYDSDGQVHLAPTTDVCN